MRYLFRDTLDGVKRLVKLAGRSDRSAAAAADLSQGPVDGLAHAAQACRSGPVLECQTTIDQLPQLQVLARRRRGLRHAAAGLYGRSPTSPGLLHSNLGMYRVQLGGNRYERNREVGLHYQIHRGIGVHHAAALD